jgi:hypothetical protein
MEPERHVFVAGGVFAVRFEFSDLVGLELANETRVKRPKLPDVVYVKQLHRPPF